MALSTRIKTQINRALALLNLRLETRVLEQQEQQRIDALIRQGYFCRQAFPLVDAIRDSSWRSLVPAFSTYRSDLDRLQSPGTNDVGFTNANPYFHSPDSDVLYAMVREHRPARIVEIGSGNSTRLTRQAIRDGRLPTRTLSIDPIPRIEIRGFTDEIQNRCVEEIPADEVTSQLRSGDFLVIDSSHRVAIGNDCVYQFLQVLPRIKSGVIVHVHDIFLPWDYPLTWLQCEPEVGSFAEQYLLQTMLMSGDQFEVLWPGYFVQKTLGAEFDEWFPHRRHSDATSFWMRRR